MQWLGFLIIVGVSGISYAAFSTIPQEIDGQPLTATKWNTLVDNVNNILTEDVIITATVPANQIRTNTCEWPWATLNITTEGLYFLRGNAEAYRYNGNYSTIAIRLWAPGWAIVFEASDSLVNGSAAWYIRVNGSDIVFLPVGIYNLTIYGHNASNCATSSLDKVLNWDITARLLR
jgi:hypothetical protein